MIAHEIVAQIGNGSAAIAGNRIAETALLIDAAAFTQITADAMDECDLSFDSLYEKHAPAVYRFALCLVGDPSMAEDLTSEAFFRAWTQAGKIHQPTIRSYLFTIAKNVYRDQLRKNKRQVALSEDIVDHSTRVDRTVEREQGYRHMLELVAELPEPDREIIVMRCQEDMPYEEIASILNLSPANVRIRAHRARRRLLQAYSTRATKS